MSGVDIATVKSMVAVPVTGSTAFASSTFTKGTATVIVKDCGADVSTPPLAMPPLSCSVKVIVAVPNLLPAGVYVSVPAELTAGCVEKSAEFVLFVTLKVSVWPDSSGGPIERLVAQLFTVCAPALMATV